MKGPVRCEHVLQWSPCQELWQLPLPCIEDRSKAHTASASPTVQTDLIFYRFKAWTCGASFALQHLHWKGVLSVLSDRSARCLNVPS
jgi:hypothetical protein